jgi:hypothetical protein
MDTNYYSEKILSDFVIANLCQKDKLLQKYYSTSNISKFRKRFIRIGGNTKDIDTLVYAVITDSMRDLLVDIIGELTDEIRPMGDIILTGGEAFNTYFSREDRLVTSDIDAKFVPIFKLKSGKIVSIKNPRYFEYMQLVKLFLWDKMGKYAVKLSKLVEARIELIKKTKIGKILGISLPNSETPYVTRRYSLIPKKRQKLDKNTVTAGDILIDVEVFALDMDIRHFDFTKNRISVRPIGGILDIALMRPYEFGYDVAFSRTQGYTYTDQNTGKIKYNKNILVAGKKFLLDDLYIMKSLGLRPLKVKKDHTRLVDFSRKILGVKNIKVSDSDENIHKKASKYVRPEKRASYAGRPHMTREFLSKIRKLNPRKYTLYTSVRWRPVVRERIAIGVKAPRNLEITNFQKTAGIYRFNIDNHMWVVNTDNSYIKNEYTHRPVLSKLKTIPNVTNASTILYGYNPTRNHGMNKNLIKKSAIIAINGLKNMNFLKLK